MTARPTLALSVDLFGRHHEFGDGRPHAVRPFLDQGRVIRFSVAVTVVVIVGFIVIVEFVMRRIDDGD